MDRIRIEDLEIFAYHGVFPEENTLGQKFVISADLYTDTRKAGLKDDLAESIHYGEVCAFMELYLKKHTYKLLESAAEHLAEELLLKYKSLKKIRLDGYPAYFDFKDNPTEYYPEFSAYSNRPMGFTDTLRCRGTFDDWVKLMNTVFDDAMRFHQDGRGSQFVHAEAVFLKRQFNRIVAQELGRPVETGDPELEESGLKIFKNDTTRMPDDIRKQCQGALDKFCKEGEKSSFFHVFIRDPSTPTFVAFLSKGAMCRNG